MMLRKIVLVVSSVVLLDAAVLMSSNKPMFYEDVKVDLNVPRHTFLMFSKRKMTYSEAEKFCKVSPFGEHHIATYAELTFGSKKDKLKVFDYDKAMWAYDEEDTDDGITYVVDEDSGYVVKVNKESKFLVQCTMEIGK